MQIPEIPTNEIERQLKLESYEILDTDSEIDFDAITQIAARILNVPICVISMIDSERQWFKSKYGLDASQTPRDISFCGHAINFDDIFVVENALEDVRFFDNPLVSGGPNIRFYAGAQLSTSDGFNLGTICAIDDKPRKISDDDKKLLKVFAKNVISLFEIKLQNKNLKESLNEIKVRNETLSNQLLEKEKSIFNSKGSLNFPNSTNLKEIESFSLINKLNFIKNAVANVLLEKNNKLLVISDKDSMISTNEVKIDFVLKYLFLTINDLFSNEIFILKSSKIGLIHVFTIKNTFWILWKSKNKNSDIQLKELLESNKNYQKLLELLADTNYKINFIYNSTDAFEVGISI